MILVAFAFTVELTLILLVILFTRRSSTKTIPPSQCDTLEKELCGVCTHKNGYHNLFGCAYGGCACKVEWSHRRRS